MSAALFSRRAVAGARAFSTSSPRSLARINILGNLADAPELVPTQSGREIVRYTVVSNTGSRDNRHASFFRVTNFQEDGPSRDFILGLPKGTQVYLEGNATLNQYQNAEGKTQTALNIVQRSVEVLRRPQTQQEEHHEE